MATTTIKTVNVNNREFEFTRKGDDLKVVAVYMKGTELVTLNLSYDLRSGKLPASVHEAFIVAFPIVGKRIASVAPKSNTTVEVKEKKMKMILVKKDADGNEVEVDLKTLPAQHLADTVLRVVTGTEDTVGDAKAIGVKVDGMYFPIGHQQIQEACKLHFGTAPTITPAGEWECEPVGVAKKDAKGNIKSYEFKIRKTGSGKGWKTIWANDKVCLDALKEHMVPGQVFHMHSLGSLISKSNNVVIERLDKVVNLDVFAWRLNKVLELNIQGKDEEAAIELIKAKYDMVPEFEKDLYGDVIAARANLRASNVVLDTDVLPRNIVAFGRKFAKKVLQYANRIRINSSQELGPISVEDLSGLKFEVAVRYPLDSPTNCIVGTIALADDDVNAIFTNAEDLLDANGDADGDTLAIEFAQAVIESLLGHKQAGGKTHTPNYIRCMPRIKEFGIPVDKNGLELNVFEFEGVAPRNPIDVMVGQMAKRAYTGACTNGMNSFIILARCLGDTPISRMNLLSTLGIERTGSHDITQPQTYKRLVSRFIKQNLIILDEAIMDVWKGNVGTAEGDAEVFLPQLDHVMQFLTVDHTYLSEPFMATMNPDFNAAMLNKLKKLAGGYAPQKAIMQWPVAASVIGDEMNTQAILDAVDKYGVERVLRFLDGSECEPKVMLVDESGEAKVKPIKPYTLPATGFDAAAFDSPWNSIQQYVNNVLKYRGQGIAPLSCGVEDHKLVLKFFGHTVSLSMYRFELEGDSPTCVHVTRGGKTRIARLIATCPNLNAAKMIRNGAKISEAITETRYETILDRFAYTCLELANTIKDQPEMNITIFSELVSTRLAKVFDDNTEIVNSPDFETNVHDLRVNLEFPSVGGSLLIPTAREIAPMFECMVNPLDGLEMMIHFGMSSKNKPGCNAAVYYKDYYRATAKGDLVQTTSRTCPIDMAAHLLAGQKGVNDARLWKEGWTTRFAKNFLVPGEHRMLNGWESQIEEIHAKSKDILVLIADMTGLLSYDINGRRITSDKGVITPHGAQLMATMPHAKRDVGLRYDTMLHICKDITGIEDDSAKDAAIQMGYVIVEDTRPLSRDLVTMEPIEEVIYTIYHPTTNETATWMKLYFEGYKGIFVVIDQDFEVEVGNGKREMVAAIMDSRTFAAKKMHAAYIAGALALYGKSYFGNKAIFGANSLQEDLCGLLLCEDNKTGHREVFDMDGKSVGVGLPALFRTFVLKADPEYMSIEQNDFKATPDLMNLLGREYKVSKRITKRLEHQVKAILQ